MAKLRVIVLAVVVATAAAAAWLAFVGIPVPSAEVERVIPNARFAR